MPDGSSTTHLYQPKLVATFREGYDAGAYRKDVLAALTVAIVALPLSMAFAIASGLSPEHGLFAAIVGGFLVSALGGSRYQIGGPAGAFIVLVSATVAQHGVSGMLLTVLLFPVFYALHQYLEQEKQLTDLDALAMTGIYLLLLYFLFTGTS